ncbi:MAG: VOC family protein, partial [Proteobacteria bacterium]|nr:VOC family protein [Pseudomonadota bacterium]
MTKKIPPFHLAFPVRDIAEAHDFYVGVLGCGVGRSTDDWMDFDFFGHQVVAHRVETDEWSAPKGDVDGHKVPTRHFGVVLDWDDWQA